YLLSESHKTIFRFTNLASLQRDEHLSDVSTRFEQPPKPILVHRFRKLVHKDSTRLIICSVIGFLPASIIRGGRTLLLPILSSNPSTLP
ncbi:hypothetical protein U1Q18_015415, partial [Sarracenia purpurea var. burkii]